jgi:hypothetical protein
MHVTSRNRNCRNGAKASFRHHQPMREPRHPVLARVAFIAAAAWMILAAVSHAWKVGAIGLAVAAVVALVVWSALGYRRR